MKTETTHLPAGLSQGISYLPCVSILLPFNPKISLRSELEYRLKVALGKVEKQLLNGYEEEKAVEVIHRLQELVKGLDFDTRRKSIAIFVSPLVKKVVYLDMPVEEKIVIDESFEIRDLVMNEKELHQYLVLVLSSQESRIYHGNQLKLTRIPSGIPEHAVAFLNEAPERVANFSDPARRKEVLLDKYLHHIDESLNEIFKTYPVPLFIMGTVRTTGHFNKLTRFGDRVIAYIHGNFAEASEGLLRAALEPHMELWKKKKEAELLHQLDAAMSAGKLAVGIEQVWKEAAHKNGRLLVVEKNFVFPAQHGDEKDLIYPWDNRIQNDLFVKDAVDDVIEKVLSSGGDVEFVEPGVLKDYSRIALIGFFKENG